MAYEYGFGYQPDEWIDDEEWFDENGNRHVGLDYSHTPDDFEYKIIDWFDDDGNYHIVNVKQIDAFLRAGKSLFVQKGDKVSYI